MPDVRDNITRIIHDRAHKQATIAQRAGLTADQFCAVLKRRRKLDANEFLAVCAALDMKPEDVAGYSARTSREEVRPTRQLSEEEREQRRAAAKANFARNTPIITESRGTADVKTGKDIPKDYPAENARSST